MMNLISTILVFTSFSFLVVGDRGNTSAFIRNTYVNHKEKIDRAFSDIDELENPCFLNWLLVVELQYIGISKIKTISSEVKRGDFGEEGFGLILDDLSTIDIPAIIKCTPIDKNDEPIKYDQKYYGYFLVPYLDEQQKLMYDRAETTDKPTTDGTKSIFILSEAKIVRGYTDTFNSNHNGKKIVSQWFNKAKDSNKIAKKQCEKLKTLGLMYEIPGTKWDILHGTVVSGEFHLRLTQSIEVKMNGILKCMVKVANSSLGGIKMKYFSAYNSKGELRFNYVLGPICRPTDKKRMFAINEEIYSSICKTPSTGRPTS